MPETAIHIVRLVAKRYKPQNKAHGQQGVQEPVEGVPEPEDVVPGLPELGNLVADEAQREHVQQALDNVKVAARVDRVDGSCE